MECGWHITNVSPSLHYGRLCTPLRTIALTRYLCRSGGIQFPQMAVTRNNNDEGTNSNDKS